MGKEVWDFLKSINLILDLKKTLPILRILRINKPSLREHVHKAKLSAKALLYSLYTQVPNMCYEIYGEIPKKLNWKLLAKSIRTQCLTNRSSSRFWYFQLKLPFQLLGYLAINLNPYMTPVYNARKAGNRCVWRNIWLWRKNSREKLVEGKNSQKKFNWTTKTSDTSYTLKILIFMKKNSTKNLLLSAEISARVQVLL